MEKGLRIKLVIALIVCYLFTKLPTVAAETPIMYNTYIADHTLWMIVGNLEGVQEVSCQIGNIRCPYVTMSTDVPMETYILVDNSLSIDSRYREPIRQILLSLIDTVSVQEKVTIAVFDKELHYLIQQSTDTEMMKQVVEGIEYQNLDTKVTDVMYFLCKELETVPFQGLRRIILISDGAEYSSVGYTRQEMLNEVQKLAYPVYTVGCTYGDNMKELEDMFSLSRITGAESVWLDEEEDVQIITNALNSCQNSMLVSVPIPDELGDGTEKGVQLVFRTEQEEMSVSTQAFMPFIEIQELSSNKEQSEEIETDGPSLNPNGETVTENQDLTVEISTESQTIGQDGEHAEEPNDQEKTDIVLPVSEIHIESDETDSMQKIPQHMESEVASQEETRTDIMESESYRQDETKADEIEAETECKGSYFKEKNWIFLFVMILFFAIVLVVILLLRRRARKRKEKDFSSGEGETTDRYNNKRDGTKEDADDFTVMAKDEGTLLAEEDSSTVFDKTLSGNSISIRLTDLQNPDRMVEMPLSGSINIGRAADKNHVVFDYARSVSSQHCEIFSRNGKIYIRDLDSLNGTWIDEEQIDETVLYDGAVIKMGRLRVKFEIV